MLVLFDQARRVYLTSFVIRCYNGEKYLQEQYSTLNLIIVH